MRGSRPLPAAVRRQNGDTRKLGARKFEESLKSEPRGPSGLPECPSHVKGTARKAWNFLVDQLAAMNLDQQPDALMLEGVVQAYAAAVTADKHIAQHGQLLTEPVTSRKTGELLGHKVRPNPSVQISLKSWAAVRLFAEQFALTPVSRARIKLEPSNGLTLDEEIELIICQPRDEKPPRNTN